MTKDVVEVRRLLRVCFEPVGFLQSAHSVDGNSVGTVSDYVTCPLRISLDVILT